MLYKFIHPVLWWRGIIWATQIKKTKRQDCSTFRQNVNKEASTFPDCSYKEIMPRLFIWLNQLTIGSWLETFKYIKTIIKNYFEGSYLFRNHVKKSLFNEGTGYLLWKQTCNIDRFYCLLEKAIFRLVFSLISIDL